MLQKEGREILDLKIFLCFWSESHVPVRYDFSGRYVIFRPVYPEQPGITGIWTGTKHKCFGTVLSSGNENTGRTVRYRLHWFWPLLMFSLTIYFALIFLRIFVKYDTTITSVISSLFFLQFISKTQNSFDIQNMSVIMIRILN